MPEDFKRKGGRGTRAVVSSGTLLFKGRKCKEVKLFSPFVLWHSHQRIPGGMQMTSCLKTEKSRSFCERQFLPVPCFQWKLLYIYVFKVVLCYI